MKKILITAMFGLAALNVNADGIPTNVYYSGGGYATDVFEQLNFDYQSSSTVYDTDGNGFLNAGDTIKSIGGARVYTGDTIGTAGVTIDLADFNSAGALSKDAIDWNYVTGSTPGGFPSTYGLDDEWVMGLSLDNFVGTWQAGGGFKYTSGDISLFTLYSSTKDGVWDSMVALHTYSITDSANLGTSILYDASVSSVTTDYFYADLTGDSFGTTIGTGNPVFGDIFQNAHTRPGTPAPIAALLFNPAGYDGATSYDLGLTNHDGSIYYSVPEPTSIAILGLGLLGFAGASRRKAK
ncbi:MAG: PEP-CTERM sorting domain-containing protein [Colwellia sp.]|nr:PEP-CTERM sorting domain-containing protein [Colwellia sp.]